MRGVKAVLCAFKSQFRVIFYILALFKCYEKCVEKCIGGLGLMGAHQSAHPPLLHAGDTLSTTSVQCATLLASTIYPQASRHFKWVAHMRICVSAAALLPAYMMPVQSRRSWIILKLQAPCTFQHTLLALLWKVC